MLRQFAQEQQERQRSGFYEYHRYASSQQQQQYDQEQNESEREREYGSEMVQKRTNMLNDLPAFRRSEIETSGVKPTLTASIIRKAGAERANFTAPSISDLKREEDDEWIRAQTDPVLAKHLYVHGSMKASHNPYQPTAEQKKELFRIKQRNQFSERRMLPGVERSTQLHPVDESRVNQEYDRKRFLRDRDPRAVENPDSLRNPGPLFKREQHVFLPPGAERIIQQMAIDPVPQRTINVLKPPKPETYPDMRNRTHPTDMNPNSLKKPFYMPSETNKHTVLNHPDYPEMGKAKVSMEHLKNVPPSRQFREESFQDRPMDYLNGQQRNLSADPGGFQNDPLPQGYRDELMAQQREIEYRQATKLAESTSGTTIAAVRDSMGRRNVPNRTRDLESQTWNERDHIDSNSSGQTHLNVDPSSSVGSIPSGRFRKMGEEKPIQYVDHSRDAPPEVEETHDRSFHRLSHPRKPYEENPVDYVDNHSNLSNWSNENLELERKIRSRNELAQQEMQPSYKGGSEQHKYRSDALFLDRSLGPERSTRLDKYDVTRRKEFTDHTRPEFNHINRSAMDDNGFRRLSGSLRGIEQKDPSFRDNNAISISEIDAFRHNERAIGSTSKAGKSRFTDLRGAVGNDPSYRDTDNRVEFAVNSGKGPTKKHDLRGHVDAKAKYRDSLVGTEGISAANDRYLGNRIQRSTLGITGSDPTYRENNNKNGGLTQKSDERYLPKRSRGGEADGIPRSLQEVTAARLDHYDRQNVPMDKRTISGSDRLQRPFGKKSSHSVPHDLDVPGYGVTVNNKYQRMTKEASPRHRPTPNKIHYEDPFRKNEPNLNLKIRKNTVLSKKREKLERAKRESLYFGSGGGLPLVEKSIHEPNSSSKPPSPRFRRKNESVQSTPRSTPRRHNEEEIDRIKRFMNLPNPF